MMNLPDALSTHERVLLTSPRFVFETRAMHTKASIHNPHFAKSSFSDGYKPSNNSIDLISNNNKAIMYLPLAFFHYFADMACAILEIHEQDPECEFFIDENIYNIHESLKQQSFYSFIYKMMDDLDIKYTVLGDTDERIININNFTVVHHMNFKHYSMYTKKLLQYVKDYIIKDSRPPFRKVYLVRNNDPDHVDSRIDNEPLIIDTFVKLGFETVSADTFTTIEDQIRFFYETKVICGFTGSGLTNMIFMQDDQLAIELLTLMVIPNPADIDHQISQFHNFYKMISFGKNQTLISVPNINRNAVEVKSIIDKKLQFLGDI